jgi:hypothetical protein
MQTMTVGYFKAHISQALDLIKQGEDVVITHGKKKHEFAVLLPYHTDASKSHRILGLLAGKATFKLFAQFKTDDSILLDSDSRS